MSTTDPTRAILYLRVSDTRNREDLISFEVQERLGRELCADRNWDVIDVIQDRDRKGSTMDRPGLNRARRAIAEGDADVIVVWRLDRFARTMMRALVVVQEIVDAGAAVVSTHPQEQLLDTSTAVGRGIAALLFGLAEEELDKIRANWRHAHVKAITDGVWMGGRHGAPLGYVKPPGRAPLQPHPTESVAVRELFERAATGVGYEPLRTWLADEHDIHVATDTVRYLLRNRVYLGEVHWGSTQNAGRKRTLVHEPLENLKAHDPIVDEITWRRAQRNGRRFGLGREKRDPRLLAGFARCAGCRSALRVVRPGNRPPYYSCRHLSLDRHRCAGPASIHAEHLEVYVERQFLAWLDSEDFHARDDGGHERLRALDARVDAVRDQLAEYNLSEVQRALGARWLEGLLARERELADAERARDAFLTELDLPAALVDVTCREDYLALPMERARLALASAVDIVFVRASALCPSGGPSRRVPIDERVRIVWAPHGRAITLPRSGGVDYVWKPFLFGDEPEVQPGVTLGEIS